MSPSPVHAFASADFKMSRDAAFSQRDLPAVQWVVFDWRLSCTGHSEELSIWLVAFMIAPRWRESQQKLQ